ncbi:MAG: bestrophin [Rhizobium sp.]|nr:bestrophin [Rhizobium sp.]
MIVRPRPSFIQLLFITRGSIVPEIIWHVLAMAAVAAVVVLAHQTWPNVFPSFGGAPFALVGIALSIFLGFRNNACYDRWWEARRQWGEMIAVARNLARQTLVLDGTPDAPARARLLHLQIAFARSLARSLRRTAGDFSGVAAFLPPEYAGSVEQSRNRPDAILRLMGQDLAALRAKGTISDIVFQVLDQSVGRLALVQAGCERIHNTPVPFAYTLLLHRTAYIFCLLMPFGFADALGWGTPFASALTAYCFFGLDALSVHLEEPFEDNPNGLALAAMSETIEINLREALGETDLPPLPQARDFLLM